MMHGNMNIKLTSYVASDRIVTFLIKSTFLFSCKPSPVIMDLTAAVKVKAVLISRLQHILAGTINSIASWSPQPSFLIVLIVIRQTIRT